MLNIRYQRRPSLLSIGFLFMCSAVLGQTTGTLTVHVASADGATIAGARLRLDNALTGFRGVLSGNGSGEYSLSQLPLQSYRLTVEAEGFEARSIEVPLRSNVPLTIAVRLQVMAVKEAVEVSAMESSTLVDPEATGTRAALSAAGLETIPVAPGNRGLEAYLLSFPGFAMNANGAIHPRGAHNQMTYVIDGLPINDQLTGAFATALDPHIVDSLELYTGDVPVEFGSKVSGEAAVTVRSCVGSGRRFFGSTEAGIGQFGTLQNITQAGGEAGRFAYFGSVSTVKTSRYLDAVSLDNLHNGGNSERAFLRLDYQVTPRDWIRFNAMTGRSSFQLANLRSQQAAGMDQRQLLRDASFWVRWNRIISPSATWESTVAYRPSIAQLFPSLDDTPVTGAQARHLNTFTTANRVNWLRGRHSIRGGIDVQHFLVSENFGMGITDATFNVPGAPDFNDALLAYDLTRGGRRFYYADKGAGSLYSAFFQDMVKAGRFTFSLGARYDKYRFLVQGNQVQPRVGVAFHLKETGTVLRASYNRNYQTPPNENLLLSSSAEAGRLAPSAVREALGDTHVPIRPQRENVYETGVQQALVGKASVNISYYHKDSRDQQDNNNFFDTGIIFPVTLARIRVNGVEGRLNLPPFRGITATMSATHSRAISTPPFTGGLYLGQDAISLLTSRPFVIDHDQNLGVNTNVHYTVNRNWWTSLSVRYDSGLVANPSNPAVVARDPDYSDLLPYVNLAGDPPRVTPRTVTDASVGYQHYRGDRRAWSVELQCSNLFNTTALYNFQSVFVGTRVVAPRAAAIQIKKYW